MESVIRVSSFLNEMEGFIRLRHVSFGANIDGEEADMATLVIDFKKEKVFMV